MARKNIVIMLVVAVMLGLGYIVAVQTNDSGPVKTDTTSKRSTTVSISGTLDLSGQQLTTLPESVLSRTDIKVLNISNNQLATLPSGISRLTNLVELNVENNRLQSLPPEISQLKKLRKLRVDNNRLASLPVELENMIWLTQLDISNNRLSVSQQDHLKSKLTNTEVKT